MTITEPDRLPTAPLAPPLLAPPAAEACVNCGRAIDTPFCAACGEKRASDRRYTLLHFGHEVVEHLTQLDGTVVRTFRALVRRPGELTAAYMRGERIRYMKPLQLFVLVSIIHFFVAGHLSVRTFDTPLRVQYRSYVAPARYVDARLAERKVSFDSYAAGFDATSTAQSKTLIIAMVPFFALLVSLVEIRKRRPALEHLVFSLHTYAALLLITIGIDLIVLQLLRLAKAAGLDALWERSETILAFGVVLVLAGYLARSLHRSYRDGPVVSAAKGLILAGGVTLLLFAYRIVLFYTTFWAT